MDREFITVKQLASQLGMHPHTLRIKIWAKEIPAYKIGGSVLLDKKEIDDWINEQKIKG